MTFEERKDLYFSRYASEILPEIHPIRADHYIVIPSYQETELQDTLDSLVKCIPPVLKTTVIIIFNYRETDSNEVKIQSRKQADLIRQWSREHPSDNLTFFPAGPFKLPHKQAGVGLARKIGMDFAVKGAHGKSVITCLDADCTVADNYLTAIEDHFHRHPNTPGASIYFEHPLYGSNREAIIEYELHLRYFNQAQRWAGFPWAYHTVGSSMTVQANSYLKVGGMNRRKAGEDFYFIHKIIDLGGFTEINNTIVYPSSRKSDRVPFGTGRAMNQWEGSWNTYPISVFEDMKKLVDSLPEIYRNRDITWSSTMFGKYLNETEKSDKMDQIIQNCHDYGTFRKHFFQWVNAFLVMKYCNERGKVPLYKEVEKLTSILGIKKEKSFEKLLLSWREYENTTSGS